MTQQWLYGTRRKGSRNVLSSSSAGASDNQTGNAELLLLFPQVLYTLTRANTLRALPATNHTAVNPLYRGKASFTVTLSNMGEAATERAKWGGIVIYITVDKEPRETRFGGSVCDTGTSRSQQAAGAAELPGQPSFFMQILEIVATSQKT